MNRRKLLLGAMGAMAVTRMKAAPKHAEGEELIGRLAPPLELKKWVNSPPLEITDLRGKVVLARWWTEGCPYCAATAPALLKLQREYGGQGLQVIGIYHPKPAGDWDLGKVERAAREKGFTFPVALDADWTALKRWWLTRDRDWTSVSFLLDRQGIIRYIHPGGEFHEDTQGGLPTHESCERDFHAIEAKIVELLG
jgi:peroxiredoxin